jgi:transcriptional regulator with PAS, ATPase and Fis domain
VEIKIDPQAEEALRSWDWPGNVRELSNVLERIVSSLEREAIYLCDLPYYLLGTKRSSTQTRRTSLKSVQGRAEKEAIRYALASANYNKARAAAVLGIHRSLLYKKMKKYNLPLNQAELP